MFAYNTTPHEIPGYQQGYLTLGQKAQRPCHNWFGLLQYDCGESISKKLWVQEQYILVHTANNMALESIRQSTQSSAQRQQVNVLEIPQGNLVQLCNYPNGCNKMQSRFKRFLFVMVIDLHETCVKLASVLCTSIWHLLPLDS